MSRARPSGIRVIGGDLRGRRLHAPSGAHTRPTSSRAREGLFGWLCARVRSAHVLDMFAGTGALGIEALSRGASDAVFIERDRVAAAALSRNLRELGLEARATVRRGEATSAVQHLLADGHRFDLVLADPPYGRALPDLLVRVQLAGLLREEGVLIVERGRGTDPERGGGCDPGSSPLLSDLVLVDSRQYGQTRFDWYERRSADGARQREDRG